MHGLFLGVSCGDGGGFDVFFWGIGIWVCALSRIIGDTKCSH